MNAGNQSQDDRLSFRHSLRWRLPVSFGVLVTLILMALVWATYREVKATLLAASRERAQIAANQIAAMLGASFEARMAENGEIAHDRVIAAYLRLPEDLSREQAARVALEAMTDEPSRRVELWNTSGGLLLERATPSVPDSSGAAWSFPPGSAPSGEGVSEIKAAGDENYFDIVVAIREGSASDAPVLGYLRRFGRLTSTAGGAVGGLIGREAAVKIGSIGGNVWTDFFSIVAPPPHDEVGGTAQPAITGDVRMVGAAVAIAGSPWLAWVGFPRSVVLAPAHAFLRRSLLLASGCLIGGVILVSLLGIRLTSPLLRLARASEEIAAGNYTRRVVVTQRDEIGRLGSAFNSMSDRIDKAHRTLKESHERTHFALGTARIGVWQWDVATGRVECSESMRLVHGLGSVPVPGGFDEFLSPVHPDDRATLLHLLYATTDSDALDVAYRAITRDGSLSWIEGKARVERDAAGKPLSVLGVSMDVTARRRLESDLRQSQKLEAVGRMAGGISHDFNNLLNVIKGCAYLMHQDLPPESPIHEDAAEIERAADRAASLTKQLLAFSRQQVLETKRLNPNDLVREVGQLLNRTIREDIDLRTHVDPAVRDVEVDPGQLHQVLMNLAVNAQDAMPNGGTLTIETRNSDISAVDLPGLTQSIPPGAYVCIRVSDTGTGMDAETQSQIFEPFFTTKAVGRGTGLGLATVYGIVKQSGGYIWVDSRVGEGTTFQILLPEATSLMAEGAPPAPSSIAKGRGESILVVEDDAALRKLFRRILEDGGYNVSQAANGEDALRVADHHDGNFDLVISDMVMPVMSGTEMAERLFTAYGGVRLLFTSGYAEDEIARHRIRFPSTAFLQKPIAPDALLERVRQLIDAPKTDYTVQTQM